MNQSTKIDLIGCDTILNSPSLPSKPHFSPRRVDPRVIKCLCHKKNKICGEKKSLGPSPPPSSPQTHVCFVVAGGKKPTNKLDFKM